MLQQHLLREPIQIVAIWKTVVIGSLIVEWTYPNGTRFHPWGTNLRTISQSFSATIKYLQQFAYT